MITVIDTLKNAHHNFSNMRALMRDPYFAMAFAQLDNAMRAIEKGRALTDSLITAEEEAALCAKPMPVGNEITTLDDVRRDLGF